MSDDVAAQLAGMLNSVIHMLGNNTNKLMEIERKLSNILMAFPGPEDGGLAGHLLDHTVRHHAHKVLLRIVVGLSISLGSVLCLFLWEIAKVHVHV
jgi:hypothetical protein